MKPEELQLGDIVVTTPSGMPIEVVAIHRKKVAYHACTDRFSWVRIGLLQPIPLTREILEKNGFVANKHVYPYPYYEYINKEDKLKIGFAFPQGNRTSYKESWVYIDSERVFVEHLPCIYAHELQHALRLCGVDKEITI